MPRRRLGVALVLHGPMADEVDGLRRALGDRALGRIPPHITLISPINVRPDDLTVALGLLRDAAAEAPGPIEVDLGPPTTFLPANPVLYLPVAGPALPVLARMRRALLTGPLARPPAHAPTWPWVPHLTLADGVDAGRVAAAAAVLDGFSVTVAFAHVVLLEERVAAAGASGPRRRWEPRADAALGPRAVIGRGGLELELTVGRLVDPEAAALLAEPGATALPATDAAEAAAPGATPQPLPLVCTARQEGVVVGVAVARGRSSRPTVEVRVAAAVRSQGVELHLEARLRAVLAAAGSPEMRYSKTEE